MPRPGSEGLSGRLIPTIFKATRFSPAPRLAVVQRLGKPLRHAWPTTLSVVRGDRPLASPEVRQWIEAPTPRRAVTGWTSHAVVQPLAHEVVDQAQLAYGRDRGTVPRCPATRSQAGTGWRARRVVINVEVSDQGVNTRWVVTDLEQARPKGLSRPLSCARGQADHAIKDHQRALQSERTSWPRCEATPFRRFWQAAADGFLDPFRRAGWPGTPWAGATMETSQLRLRTRGARVQALTARLKRSLPSSCPVAPVLRRWLTVLAGGRRPSPALGGRSRAQAAPVPNSGGRPQGADRMPCARSCPSDRGGWCQEDLTQGLEEHHQPGIRLFWDASGPQNRLLRSIFQVDE